MPAYLCLAATTGFRLCQRSADGWRVVREALPGQHLTSVIAREGVILVGSRQGVQRSSDLGQTWQPANQGLDLPYVRWLAYHPEISDFEAAGTEPAGIFISRDGAATWRRCPEIEALRDQHGWFLPYSPGAGCVRGFAFHGARAYAAVEVGGVLRSDDEARTWALAPGSDGSPDLDGPPAPFVYPDVHMLAVHPASADGLYAPTGGGFYTSADGGATWDLRYDCYVRACWVDPADPAHILLGPADGVDSRGRIEVSRDGGAAWQPAGAGLSLPWPHHMVERFVPAENDLLAILSNGQLLASPLHQWHWQPILPEAGHVTAAHALAA